MESKSESDQVMQDRRCNYYDTSRVPRPTEYFGADLSQILNARRDSPAEVVI